MVITVVASGYTLSSRPQSNQSTESTGMRSASSWEYAIFEYCRVPAQSYKKSCIQMRFIKITNENIIFPNVYPFNVINFEVT